MAAVWIGGRAAADEITLPVYNVTARPHMRVSDYPARVVPISQVNVMSQVSGEILEVCFENGAMVKEGDLLYRLDPVKYEAAVKNAESKVAECKAALSYAELNYSRHRKLSGTRAVSLDAVDNALSARDSARAALAAAQADLMSARDDLRHCRIVAPIAGKIGSTAMTRGNYAKAASEPLVSIVQMSPIRVRFSIPNSRLLTLFGGLSRRLREEANLSVKLANGEQYAVPGTFDYVENAADELTDTIHVFFSYENKEGLLRPGGTVSVTLSSKKGEMQLSVPPSAVLQDIQGPYVWVLDEADRAQRRSIARGDLQGDWMFVEKGLRPGERIVADGAHKVKRGMTVKAAK